MGHFYYSKKEHHLLFLIVALLIYSIEDSAISTGDFPYFTPVLVAH